MTLATGLMPARLMDAEVKAQKVTKFGSSAL